MKIQPQHPNDQLLLNLLASTGYAANNLTNVARLPQQTPYANRQVNFATMSQPTPYASSQANVARLPPASFFPRSGNLGIFGGHQLLRSGGMVGGNMSFAQAGNMNFAGISPNLSSSATFQQTSQIHASQQKLPSLNQMKNPPKEHKEEIRDLPPRK